MVTTSTLVLAYYELSAICMLRYRYCLNNQYGYEGRRIIKIFFHYFNLASAEKYLHVQFKLGGEAYFCNKYYKLC